MMVKKYCRVLEERDVNNATGEIWNIADVPSLWKSKVEAQNEADGYVIDEDGTVIPKAEDEAENE